MNDGSTQPKNDTDIEKNLDDHNKLCADQIAIYLLENPQFFVHHPQLVEKFKIPHSHKGSVSLVELQSEQLRKKVRTLSHKLHQLISIAKKNEEIYRIYADLNLRVLSCTNIDDLQFILEEVIQENLNLASVALKPFKGAHALPEIQRHLFLEKRFKWQKHFFGRISEHERKLLFGAQDANSVALLLLGHGGELGILAIGSKDPGHFNPEMDTLLITQLQQFLGILLPKMLTY
jgi:uncharacterized protein YigA (DUF484 family)